MDEGYSKSGQATIEDVQEWLMLGLEMLASRDVAFTQEMEALNVKKCGLVKAQQAREKRLKAAKDNLVMLENVRREKEIEVMNLHRVVASLPKHLLQAMTSRAKDMVTPGDSYGVKRNWRDSDQLHEVLPSSQAQFSHDSKNLIGSVDQRRQPSTQGTPTSRVPPRLQSQSSHDSSTLKKTWGELRQTFKSGDQPSTPIKKVPVKSQSEVSRDSYLMKRKLVEPKHKLGSGDQPSTPINKVLAKSQFELSHDSHIMKRKLMDLGHLYSSSGDQRRQPSTPTNQVLPSLQPQFSHDCNSQSLSSDLESGGKMQVLVRLMILNLHLYLCFCIIQSAHLFVGVEAAVQGDFSQIQEHGAGAKGDKAGRQRGASYIY